MNYQVFWQTVRNSNLTLKSIFLELYNRLISSKSVQICILHSQIYLFFLHKLLTTNTIQDKLNKYDEFIPTETNYNSIIKFPKIFIHQREQSRHHIQFYNSFSTFQPLFHALFFSSQTSNLSKHRRKVPLATSASKRANKFENQLKIIRLVSWTKPFTRETGTNIKIQPSTLPTRNVKF